MTCSTCKYYDVNDEEHLFCGRCEYGFGNDPVESCWTPAKDVPTPDTTSNSSAFKTQVGGQHYKTYAIQPLQYILANKLSFAEGNVVKYTTRWKEKGGVQDLKKARHYLDMMIEDEEDKVSFNDFTEDFDTYEMGDESAGC